MKNNNDKKKFNELELEAQFHATRTFQMLDKASPEQIKDYAKTLLVHYLWSDQKYKSIIRSKWGVGQ